VNSRRATDTVLDLMVHAPLGIALAVRELFPELVARGRTEVRNQSQTANAVGRLATREARRELERMLRPWLPSGFGSMWSPAASPAAAPASPPPRTEPSPARVPPLPTDEAELAIPGYDTLSASQVVARLEGLTAEELEAIRVHEAAGRARRTVLTRIAQLGTRPPSSP